MAKTISEKQKMIEDALRLKEAIFELEHAKSGKDIAKAMQLVTEDVRRKYAREFRKFERHDPDMSRVDLASILKEELECKRREFDDE